MTPQATSSTGLPSRVAAPLAYACWWVSGVILWYFERRDPYVRFHAAQASLVFGAIALVVAVLGALAAFSLLFMPKAFGLWLWLAGVSWAAGVGLWGVSIWKAATGRAWRIPVAAALADRMCRI